MTDANGPTLEYKEKPMQIGPLGKRNVSQPMELRKELAVKVSKLSFKFCVIRLGKFVYVLQVVISRIGNGV